MKLKKYGLILLLISLIFVLDAHTVHADSMIHDNASVLNRKATNAIKSVNNNESSALTGKPKIAVVTIKRTSNLNEYTQNYFANHKLSWKGYANDILIVLAKQNLQMRVMPSYSTSKALPQDWCNQLVSTGKIKHYLRKQQFNTAIILTVNTLSDKLSANSDSLKTRAQAKAEIQTVHRNLEITQAGGNMALTFLKVMLGIPFVCGIILIMGVIAANIAEIKKKKSTKKQTKL